LAMKNFETNYWQHKKIIISKDYLWFEDDVYYIPACLIWFIDLDK
jgi:hypothetical protein